MCANIAQPPSMNSAKLLKFVMDELDELQAIDLVDLDVRALTSITDHMLICTGRSSRHVKSLASHLVSQAKKASSPPLGVEGEQEAEWILVDLGDVVVHIMLPETRALYDIESLWSAPAMAEAEADET